MAKYIGNDLAVDWGATAPITPANLIKSVEIPESADVHESSGASDTAKTYLPGKTDATVRIDAWDDATAATIRTLFAPASEETLVVYPQGNTTGKPKISMSAIVTGRTHGVSHDGVAPLSIELQVNGAITETTVSA